MQILKKFCKSKKHDFSSVKKRIIYRIFLKSAYYYLKMKKGLM